MERPLHVAGWAPAARDTSGREVPGLQKCVVFVANREMQREL